MQIELTPEESHTLTTALERLASDLERELVRTDVASLQHELGRDLKRLERVRMKLLATPVVSVTGRPG